MWTRRGFLAAGSAAAAPPARVGTKDELPTPALVVDLDAFETIQWTTR